VSSAASPGFKNSKLGMLLPLLIGTGLFFCPPSLVAEDDARGQLVIIGGGTPNPRILRKFVDLSGGDKATLVVLPMASEDAPGAGQSAVEELTLAGARSVQTLILDRDLANTSSALALLRAASGVFFSGGDQSRLTRALKNTDAEVLLHEMFRGGAILAGTSAGAAVMSEIMITGGERRPDSEDYANGKIEADNVVTAPGFGFLEGVIVDQHFVRRARNNRLLSLILENPSCLGVGIDERTSIWVKPDHTFEVLGEGAAIVFDAKTATVRRLGGGPGLEAAGVTVHVLRDGSIFDLNGRRVIRLGSP
jgi:cyanophycinase